MSTVYKLPTTSPRKQEIGWMNLVFTSHDMFCDCDDPQLHLLFLINRDSEVRKPLSDVKNIKCLLTGKGATPAATEEDDPGFLEGELEKLFEENTQENGTTEDDAR